MSAGGEVILSVRDLRAEYGSRRGAVQALRGVSLDLHAGEVLALIGESGCGKSTLALALTRMLPGSARITGGSVVYRDEAGADVDLLGMDAEGLRRFRWKECAIVLQSALNAFNPVLRVRDHFLDTARAHGLTDRAEVLGRTRRLLEMVQLEASRVIGAYSHELSGGMRQRVLLALALLFSPRILILDEPTTALDILTQRAILDLLRRLQRSLGFSLVFISHDLAIAAELADRMATMYAGRVVEIASVEDAFYRPAHPYTAGLIRAVPTLAGDARELASIPGSPPDLVELPPGCKFHPRCPLADERCRAEDPADERVGDGHLVACFHWQRARGATLARGGGSDAAAVGVGR